MSELTLSQYLPFLKRVLTPARLQHSLGVMQVMGELAKIYALDEESALTAGLLHDAAKDLPVESIEQIVTEAHISFGHPCERDYVLYLHGPVGAYFVHAALGVADPAILDAIYRHTWVGEITELEPPLVWCVRFADILEPYRRWDGAAQVIREGEPRLRETVYAGRLVEAAWVQADILIRFFEGAGKPVHPNYHKVHKELSARLKKTGDAGIDGR